MTHRRGGLQRAAAPFVVSAVAAIALWATVLRRSERFAITGDSMAPTLLDGDWVIVDAHAFRRSLPRPGDIVVATDPREPSRTLVKRIDHYHEGAAWLTGDNPPASTDSRTFGYVDESLLRGRVVFRYWPPARFGKPG